MSYVIGTNIGTLGVPRNPRRTLETQDIYNNYYRLFQKIYKDNEKSLKSLRK